jgi:molecular chaperone GrpE
VAAVKVTIKDEDKKKETNEDRQVRPGGQAEKEEEEISREEMSKEDLIEKVKQLEDLSAKNFDLYVRSQAEIENMKKRFQRDREEWIKFSNESLIKEILPSVDNLEKAIAHSRDEKSLDALREGVELTLKGLKNALDKAGVEEVKAVGEPFDPNFHEAVCQQQDDRVESGTVLQEFQKGYLLNQRLIRPAMVVVSKKENKQD